jgi:hypothetical protein
MYNYAEIQEFTSLKYGLAKPDDRMYHKVNTEIIDIL